MNFLEHKQTRWRSPGGDGCDRMQPKAKSEASASMVWGRSGWKCCKMGVVVKACYRVRKAASASRDQADLTTLRVRVMRGVVREE